MISNMHYLGKNHQAINNAVESAENLLKHEDFDFTTQDIDNMNEWALEYLKENGDFGDITNSIIYAYFSSARAYVNRRYPKAQIDYYINCNDSYLYYNGDEV